MSKQNIRQESDHEASDTEAVAKQSGSPAGLTEVDKSMADDLIQPGIEGTKSCTGHEAMDAALMLQDLFDKLSTEEQTLLDLVFLDYSGAEIAASLAVEPATARKRVSRLKKKLASIYRGKQELAYERIKKDQEEVEQLKTETRAMLTELCAA